MILTCLWAPHCSLSTISYKSSNSADFSPNMSLFPLAFPWGKSTWRRPYFTSNKMERNPSYQTFHILPQSPLLFGPEKKEMMLNSRRRKCCFPDAGQWSVTAEGSPGGVLGSCGWAVWSLPWSFQSRGESTHWPMRSQHPTQTDPNILEQFEISHERRSKLQIRPSFQGQPGQILRCHQLLSQGPHMSDKGISG